MVGSKKNNAGNFEGRHSDGRFAPGNKLSLGNCGGVPLEYDSEWLKNEARLFSEWMNRPHSVYFKSFCIERGYSPQRLSEFAQKSPEFAEVYKIAKEWQESKLVNLGLWNEINPTMTKFVLLNQHEWSSDDRPKDTSMTEERRKPLMDLFNAMSELQKKVAILKEDQPNS